MAEYFSHDYNARNDLRLKRLLMRKGVAGIGLYWCIVEILYEQNGYAELEDIPVIAFDLKVSEEDVYSLINDFDLFKETDTQFFSEGVLKRLSMRAEKSEKARKSVSARWKKNDCNTSEVRAYNECITTDEQSKYEDDSPVILIKENKSKVKENNTLALFEQFWKVYPKKCAKINAQKVFQKLHVDQSLLDRMLSALEKQKQDTQWQNKQFIPYPATWLNSHRWEDENELDVPENSAEEFKMPEMTREDLERIYQEPVGRTAEEIKAMSMEELFE